MNYFNGKLKSVVPMQIRILTIFAKFSTILFTRLGLNFFRVSVSVNYRLTHSASELSEFTCTSSLIMNENK